MFVVENILISDDVVDAPFACNLDRCLGGCCVQGDHGAPLEPEERAVLDEILPRVRKYLRPEALKVIEEEGTWEETDPGEYATTCVEGKECVFVMYEGAVAKCAIQKVHLEGKIDFPKPVSCHLFPLRISRFGDEEVINYEQIPLCAPACKKGRRKGIQLHDFLREPLVRKYGENWYQSFREACIERQA